MARSPIEAMIDAACACVKCGRTGPPGSCGCWVRLECPKCGTSRLVERDEFDPPNTARVRINCPECDSGDFGSPAYFDAAGRELSWEDAPAIADRNPEGGNAVPSRSDESGGSRSEIAQTAQPPIDYGRTA